MYLLPKKQWLLIKVAVLEGVCIPKRGITHFVNIRDLININQVRTKLKPNSSCKLKKKTM